MSWHHSRLHHTSALSLVVSSLPCSVTNHSQCHQFLFAPNCYSLGKCLIAQRYPLPKEWLQRYLACYDKCIKNWVLHNTSLISHNSLCLFPTPRCAPHKTKLSSYSLFYKNKVSCLNVFSDTVSSVWKDFPLLLFQYRLFCEGFP